MRRRDLTILFSWVPSHVGLRHNEVVDRLVKEACLLPPPVAGRPLSLTDLSFQSSLSCFLPCTTTQRGGKTPQRNNRLLRVCLPRQILLPSSWPYGAETQCRLCSSTAWIPDAVAGCWSGRRAPIRRMPLVFCSSL